MLDAFSLFMCVLMRARVSGGASNKGDKSAVDVCGLTASHSGTRTHTEGERQACTVHTYRTISIVIATCEF